MKDKISMERSKNILMNL